MPSTILHILLAILLVVSSAGLTVNKHFCRMQLQDIAVLVTPPSCHSKAALGLPTACSAPSAQKSCCSAAKIPSCHKAAATDANDEEKNGCCHNESEWIKTFISQVVPHISHNILPDFESLLKVLLPIILPHLDGIAANASFVTINDPPPLLHQHSSAWVQSFLC